MDWSELFAKEYSETIARNGEAFYKRHEEFLNTVFNKTIEEDNNPNIQPRTNLDKIDLGLLMQKNNITCSKCENFSDKEFSEFLSIFSKQNAQTPKNSLPSPANPQQTFKPVFGFNKNTSFESNSEKLKKIYYPSSKEKKQCAEYNNVTCDLKYNQNNARNGNAGDLNNYNRLEVQASTSKNCSAPSSFRTAHEELQLQNTKKFGSSNSNNAGGASKRTLGANRRNIRNRFISPLLSNNSSSNEEIRPEVNPEPIDERLKNIEPEMVELIKSEIMDCGPGITWDDIAGLEFAKTAIQEAVVWPILRPDIFTGLRRPPKGILLFGPPGTGKTLIGKCVAAQSKSTFFSISASSLTSKWIGNGEKMVRALFAVARVHQPAVIFIDEIDSLLSQRSDSEHESSRRIKTEFLVQLDGATTDNEERILVIGATNRPQELDEAARRRFVKRLYIPLPEYEARLQLVQKLISNERHTLQKEDFEQIATSSDGYSGADIRNLCSEASLGPIRAIDMRFIEKIEATEVRPLAMSDFLMAFTRVKSSIAIKDLEQYKLYNQTYGSGGGF